MIRTNFNTRALSQAAGYNTAQLFLSDVTRYDLPIVSHSSRFSRDNVYGPTELCRALVLGRLRNLGFPALRALPYLNAVDGVAVEDAWQRFAANQCGELWPAVAADGSSVISEERSAITEALADMRDVLVIDLAAALGVPATTSLKEAA